MTTSEAMQKFNAALTIYQTPELVEFHHEISQSDLSRDEKNFWLCLCNDIEDLKENFYRRVECYILDDGGKLNRRDWSKYNYFVRSLN